jgi:hypothetical protein
MDNTAIGAGFILFDIAGFHHLMVARDLKNVGMHEKDEDIAPEFEAEFKLSAVFEVKSQRIFSFFYHSLVFCHQDLSALFKSIEYIERGPVNFLLQASFADDGFDQ